MNASTSEYSSGCESGWTTYLDQMSNSDPYSFYTNNNNYQQKDAGIPHINVDHHDDDDEEEDLSMVSDASSAPPNSTYYYSQHKNNNKKNKNYNNKSIKEHNLCLDDTATSSILHFPQDNVPSSHEYHNSPTHFQGESVTKNKRLGFFKSSTKGKSGNVGRKRQ